MTNELKEQVITLRKEGKTYNEIHELLGVAKSSISDICRKLNLGSGITLKKLTPELKEEAQKLYDEILMQKYIYYIHKSNTFLLYILLTLFLLFFSNQ